MIWGEPMKRRLWELGIALLAGAAFCGYRYFKNRKAKKLCVGEADQVDGGVRNVQNPGAPKTIQSTEISAFHCVFSLYAMVDPGNLENRVYKLDAVLENGIVKGCLRWYDRIESEQTAFEAQPEFLEKLQQIVTRHALARNNGYVHTVSGLPDMYGAMLDVSYCSGESIYADDNQECFLSMEAMEEMVVLFREYAQQ